MHPIGCVTSYGGLGSKLHQGSHVIPARLFLADLHQKYNLSSKFETWSRIIMHGSVIFFKSLNLTYFVYRMSTGKSLEYTCISDCIHVSRMSTQKSWNTADVSWTVYRAVACISRIKPVSALLSFITRTFIHPYVHPSIHAVIRPSWLLSVHPAFIYTLVYSFIQQSTHPCFHSFIIDSRNDWLIDWSIHPTIGHSIHLYSIIHSSIQSPIQSICPCAHKYIVCYTVCTTWTWYATSINYDRFVETTDGHS